MTTIPPPTQQVVDGNKKATVPWYDFWRTSQASSSLSFIFSPEQFGAKGDGVTDDTDAFTKLAAAVTAKGSGVIIAPPGKTYKVWPQATTPDQAKLMQFSNCTGIRVYMNGSKITTANDFTTGALHNGYVIYSYFCNDVHIDGLVYEQTVATAISFTAGAYVYSLQGAGSDYLLTNTKVTGAAGCLAVVGQGNQYDQLDSATINNVTLLNADLTNVYYGANFRFSGNNFFCRGMRCNGIGRAYFPYGVHDHDVEFTSLGASPGDQVILLKCYNHPSGFSIRNSLHNIRVRASVSDNPSAAAAYVQFAFQQLSAVSSPGRMANIHVTIDMRQYDANTQRIGVDTTKLDVNGAADATTRGYQFENITVSGTFETGNNALNMFNPAQGTWTNEGVRNIKFENLSATNIGSLDGTGIQSGLMFLNVRSTNNITLTGVGFGVLRTFGCNIPNLQDILKSFPKASLPSAVNFPQLVYVTDESGGAVPAFSDGTNWRRVTDRAVVT